MAGVISEMAIGRAKAAITQTLHGEMNATDAKNRKRVEVVAAAVAVAVVAEAQAAAETEEDFVGHHRAIGSIDVIKVPCVVVVIVEMTATDHINSYKKTMRIHLIL